MLKQFKEIIGEPLVINGRQLSLSRAVRAGDLIFLTGQIPMQNGAPMTDGSIEDQTRACLEAIGDTLRKQAVEVKNTLDRASEQATEVGTVFVDQAQMLTDSANKAEAQAKVIRQNTFDSRRDTFLRASRFVIEDLNSTAIDLNSLLDTQGSQRLWSRLTKGDKGIFVRTMLSDDEKHAREVIRAKFEEDENFRKYVQRYLDHFERLLNQANESDPENLLSSTFLSADIGKLYLVLARSVGRLN